MDKKPLLDEKAREKIRTALDTTLLVEAGAGSGKTHSLVDRMLALLASGKARINTFAAVTFTRKAAAELRGRFQTELEKAVLAMRDREEDKEIHERLSEALHYLEQAFIGTIHSFCAKILKERPIEIALDPDFRELEEIENAIFRENCWHEYLVKARLEDAEALSALEKASLTAEELKEPFESLSLYPEVVFIGGSGEEPDYGKYRMALEGFLKTARKRVPSERPEKGWDDLQYLMHRCFLRQGNMDFRDHGVLMETLEILDKNAGVTQNRWPSKEEALDFRDAFESFKIEVASEALRQWREFRHSKILAFLEPALDYFKEKRLVQSKLNFQDQLMLASELLRDNPEVRQYFSLRYSHILVDEFQDTDPIQAEVLLYLAGTDVEEKDWHKLVPRPGSLFLVGDPKQSIFRFRRADIDTYNLVKEQIEKGGGEVLHLTTNFRSLDALADWNNGVFDDVFPDEADRYQAAFAPMNTVREDEERLHGVYKITIPKQERNKESLIVEVDSEMIADFISGAFKDGEDRGEGKAWEPSDFMILFRYKKNMTAYARALEKRGIPYEITGSGAFSESEEAREILNLARALNDPDNPIYTVAVLRGIFFGVSDEDLYEHKRNGGWFNFLKGDDQRTEDEEVDGKKEDPEERVSRGLSKLKQWWGWIRKYPATTALEMIFEDTGIVNYAASSEMGSSRAGNLFKLLAILRGQEMEGAASFSELVDYLEELVSVYEIEEMSLTPGRKNAVRLMNLHKAKGLEASFVFLANPVGVRGHDPDKHIIREGMTPEGYFLCSKKTGMYQWTALSQPVGWEGKAEEEKQYADAEEQRLMYVASTRAKDCMVVSTYEGALGDRRAWGVLDEYIHAKPELEIKDVQSVEDRKKLRLERREWEEAKEELKERRDKVAVASYAVENVTSLAKKDLEVPEWRRGSYGMAWGRAVHKMLEVVGKWDADFYGDGSESYRLRLNRLVKNVLVTEEMSLDKKGELVRLVQSIVQSEFWDRVKNAEMKLFEVPFSILTDKEALPTILTGAIDLAFIEGGSWVIADFKTDDVGTNLQSFVDYYTPQVQIYCRHWADITQQPIKEAGLYFTVIQKWVKIEWNHLE